MSLSLAPQPGEVTCVPLPLAPVYNLYLQYLSSPKHLLLSTAELWLTVPASPNILRCYNVSSSSADRLAAPPLQNQRHFATATEVYTCHAQASLHKGAVELHKIQTTYKQHTKQGSSNISQPNCICRPSWLAHPLSGMLTDVFRDILYRAICVWQSPTAALLRQIQNCHIAYHTLKKQKCHCSACWLHRASKYVCR